jgi:outer membrane cobalamin receptor
LFLCAALLAAPVVVLGAPPKPCGASPGSITSQPWPAPLDRLVTVHARDIALRDALDLIAAAAHLRLSYTSETLPADDRVCAAYSSMPVGDVLADLLEGLRVKPVLAGGNQIVLSRAAEEPVPPPVFTLDRLVVTGNVKPAPQRPLTVALDVLKGNQLGDTPTESVAEALNAGAPGVWMWNQAPSKVMASYGSIRGASSFGISSPKIYIDGIEVANPLLLTRFAPDAVDRIEVIRGPQGAALYGADAISGVLNIITRNDGASTTPRRVARTGLGMSSTSFAPRAALAQDHSVSLHAGEANRSATVNIAGGGFGDFIPGGDSWHLLGNGGARMVGTHAITTLTGRMFVERAGAPLSPLLAALNTQPAQYSPSTSSMSGSQHPQYGTQPPDRVGGPDSARQALIAPSGRQSVSEYTFGFNTRVIQNDRWVHSLVAGVDGYTLSGAPDDYTPIPSAADSALRAARGNGTRLTMRASTAASFGENTSRTATLTIAAEQSVLRTQSEADADESGSSHATLPTVSDWQSSTGVLGQINAGFQDRYFLTAGLREERDVNPAGIGHYVTLPELGGAYARDFGDATLKLRAGFGKGIRPVQTASRGLSAPNMHAQLERQDLAPERQVGVEAGADLLIGRVLSLQVTRFDQRASGLIQRVGVAFDSLNRPGSPPRISYELQNVGAIRNRGWELQGSMHLSRLTLAGTFSTVDSRVVQVAAGYTGDLHPGDRMLEVPSRTASLTASYASSHWQTSLSAYRAADWINYDRLSLADNCVSGKREAHMLVGNALRSYWRHYDGATRLNATLTRDISHGVTFVATGSNLLNYQRGEPDNVTIVPGRTITLGMKAEF